MYNLILKDVKLQKWLHLFYIAIAVFYLLMESSLAVVIGIIGINYAINCHWGDHKKNGNMFLLSLPYSRTQIILSKFTGTFLFTLITAFAAAGFQSIYSWIMSGNLYFASPAEILTGILLVMIGASFYFPFFYKFDNKYLLAAFSFILVLLIFTGYKLMDYAGEQVREFFQTIVKLSQTEQLLYLGIAAIGITVLSFLLTVQIYKKRDF
ncbi:ABC-2 transporter permease [Metabacillus sp. 84]|uniref:ABC-2 transporter permease n=1 Tax=unclassified Metabacillus TaxID=2675274 RepID=UPI003CED9D1E